MLAGGRHSGEGAGMTEREWLDCADPEPMLRLLLESPARSERKLRLFACACVRRSWASLTDPRSREAVKVAERFADGRASEGLLLSANEEAHDGWDGQEDEVIWTAAAAILVTHPNARQAAVDAARCAAAHFAGTGWRASVDAAMSFAATRLAEPPRDSPAWAERRGQAALLRCVFGPSPFRRVPLPRSVLAWSGGLLAGLAEAAYEHRLVPGGELDPQRLAVLADALEEAGCTDADTLDHLRGGGPHFRGCWPVDLCLCKE
jgi:hypothetical protein